jgi:hypothetical protein
MAGRGVLGNATFPDVRHFSEHRIAVPVHLRSVERQIEAGGQESPR